MRGDDDSAVAETVGVALIGLGRMGRVHLETIVSRVPRLRVAAVAEPRPDAIAAVADLLGAATAYEDAGAALRHPGLDGCVVVTPTETHDAVVGDALELGLHVLCEKPLTLDLSESARLRDAAAARGVALQVGFWRRFSPPLVEARRLLRDGRIGRAVLVRLAQWDVDCPPAAWCDPSRSGGIFVDMGVHEFDELEWLLDARIREVQGIALPLVEPALADVGDFDNAIALVEVENRVHAVVELSRNGRYGDDIRLEILGSDGAILVETLPTPRVRLGTRAGLETVWEAPGSDAFVDGIAAELAAFADLVAGGGAPVPGAAESIRATFVGDAARASAAAGAPMRVPSEI